MDMFNRAIGLLPPHLGQSLMERDCVSAEEIRLRLGRPVSLLRGGKEQFYGYQLVSEKDMLCVLEKATGASLHTAAPELIQGYISCKGLRIGICGQAGMHDGKIKGFRSISSLSIRIPRECKAVLDKLIPALYPKGFESTLIISPPGRGKTTALRELIRCIAESGKRVGVADERNELSASGMYDLGLCSDVLIDLPKETAAMMLLRGMNPQFIAMDEITKPQDIDAVKQIIGCGVAVLATVHGESSESIRKKALYKELLDEGVFPCCINISSNLGKRTYTAERLCG